MRLRLLTLTALGVGLITAAAAAPREVTMVADPWCPYNCTPGDPAGEGFYVDLVKAALQPLGYTVVYKLVPWEEAILAVRKGTYDILIASDPHEAPALVFPYFYAPCGYDVFARAGEEFVYAGPRSLGQRKLGVVKDYFYGQAEADYIGSGKPPRVQATTGTDALAQNVRKLLARDVDVIFENPAVLGRHLEAQGLTDKLASVGFTSHIPCSLGLSPAKKDTPSLVSDLERRVRELQAGGTLETLKKKYGLDLHESE